MIHLGRLPSSFVMKYILFSALLIVIVNNILFQDYRVFSNNVAAVLVILNSIYLVFIYRKSTSLFVLMFFLAYINYSIAIGIYLIPNRPTVLYSQITDTKTLGIGILTILIFTALLIFFAPRKIDKSVDFQFRDNIRQNVLIAWVIILILVPIGILGYNANFGMNIRGNSSPIYEYSTLFFILGFYYAGNNKITRAILSCIVYAFMLQSFITGNRVEAVCFGIAYFICNFSTKVNYKKMIPVLVTGIIIMAFIGEYRSYFNLSGEGFYNAIVGFIATGFVFDTATWAYFPSVSIIKVTNDDVVPFFEKVYLFKQSLLYIFFGSKVLDNNIASYVQRYYFNQYGTVSPAYYYFWFRWAGVLMFSFVVNFYVRLIARINHRNSSFRTLLSAYIIASVPRWYLYGPNPLFRDLFLYSVVYLSFNLLDNIITKRKRIENSDIIKIEGNHLRFH